MTDEKKFKKLMVPKPVHHWLLVSACLMTFVVLPLLFVWSSLNIIHNRTGDGVLLSEAMEFDPNINTLKKMSDQQTRHRNES